MRLNQWLIAGFVVLASSQSGLAQPPLTRVQMDDDVRQLIAVARRGYSYIDEKKEQYGVDLDFLQADALRRLDKVKSNADFHDLLKEIMAAFRDGHCEVDAAHLSAPKPAYWPVRLQFVKEGVLVSAVHPTQAGAGIRCGDLLRAVDGRPIEEWIMDSSRGVSASTHCARRRIALERMLATAKKTVKMRVEHPDGTFNDVAVTTGPRLHEPVVPGVPELPAGAFAEGCVLKDGLGYIRITSMSWHVKGREPCMTDAEFDALFKPARDWIDAAFEAVAKTKTLVLDLRGNTGGWDNVGAHVACHLVPDDFRYVTHQTRVSPDEWGPKTTWEPRKSKYTFYQGKPYAGRVVVLIDERSFSATDTLAAALADLRPDIRFVGRATHAGAGGPNPLGKLKYSGVGLVMCTMRIWSPKGRLIEGHGTRPDVPVEWTREDVLKNRDADLEAARKDLRR